MKRINITEGSLMEAMAQIDSLNNLNARQLNCLRLLTDEMYSMVNTLVNVDMLDYEIGIEDTKYTLRVSVRAHVDEKAREHFLSMSSDGRNAANKGIMGMLGAVMESLLYGESTGSADASWSYGICAHDADYTSMWALSQYIETAPAEKAKSDWDGMEKSIIVNFSDDVTIGVRAGRLEMIVTKVF